MVGQCALIRAVGGPADQDEAPIAIAAIDITMLVDLQEHARMAERCAAGNVGRPVASDTGLGDADEFGGREHVGGDSKRGRAHQSPSLSCQARRVAAR